MLEIPVYFGKRISHVRLTEAIVNTAAEMKLKVVSNEDITKEAYFLNPARKNEIYDRTIIKIIKPTNHTLEEGLESMNWFADIEFTGSSFRDANSFCLKRRDVGDSMLGCSDYEKLVLQYLDSFSKKL